MASDDSGTTDCNSRPHMQPKTNNSRLISRPRPPWRGTTNLASNALRGHVREGTHKRLGHRSGRLHLCTSPHKAQQDRHSCAIKRRMDREEGGGRRGQPRNPLPPTLSPPFPLYWQRATHPSEPRTLDEPKVGDFHVSIVVNQQVGGLNVPVDLVFAVDELQALDTRRSPQRSTRARTAFSLRRVHRAVSAPQDCAHAPSECAN